MKRKPVLKVNNSHASDEITRLSDMDIDHVAIVTAGANRKTFVVRKEDRAAALADLFGAVLALETADDAQFKKAAPEIVERINALAGIDPVPPREVLVKIDASGIAGQFAGLKDQIAAGVVEAAKAAATVKIEASGAEQMRKALDAATMLQKTIDDLVKANEALAKRVKAIENSVEVDDPAPRDDTNKRAPLITDMHPRSNL